MKITKQITTEETIEVKLPYFSKHLTLPIYCKIFGEGSWDCIKVERGEENSSIGINITVSSIAITDRYAPISEDEFETAYYLVKTFLDEINNIVPETVNIINN